MKISSAFPGKYIKAGDLTGQPRLAVMESVVTEMVGQGNDAEQKPVVYFKGVEQGLVLNVTNANTISGLYGDETDAWRGRAIVLFQSTCEMGGKIVDCIRVRAPKTKQPAESENHEDQQAPVQAARSMTGSRTVRDDFVQEQDEVPF